MATDLFGKPIGGYPEFKLTLQQKRQATLLYHWMSLDYLKGLKAMIDALIKGADVNLELAKRQGRDALITNDRWGVRDTSANWSTHVFPALEDFRKSTIRLMAWRAAESYCGTGANQCGRMISEFSSMWMTQEEEEHFTEQWEAIYRYASKIDDAAGSGGQRRLDDFSMVMAWQEHAHLFPRLPKFRVRTDVEAISDRMPPRTGVYVPQDDESGALQFAWRGNDDGILGDAQTFNAVGQRLLAEVGRNALWIDDDKLIPIAIREMERDPTMDTGMNDLERVRAKPSRARNAMAFAAFTTRPCKWYFVEMIDGEFDDTDSDPVGSTTLAQDTAASRCLAGQPCPREGWWFTPAKADSRQHFAQGQMMPAVGGDYGTTIWQWDEQQGS